MRKHLLPFFLLCEVFVLSSCVSVKFSPDVQKSKHVTHAPLAADFREVELKPADRAWKSAKTGNTISYFSECTPNLAPIERVRDEALASLPKSKVLSSQETSFDEREALDSLLEGRVEGIPVKISLLVYQKNGCRYSLSYTARSDAFDAELPEFERFKRGFKAP